MAKKILWSGSTVLPSPVSISVNDQIIWSANTGRSASGSMIGDVVAEMKDVAKKGGILTEAELAAIKKIMVAGRSRRVCLSGTPPSGQPTARRWRG